MTGRTSSSLYFYPRPLRGGRPQEQEELAKVQDISIHALCEEGDQREKSAALDKLHISIHALCEEGDALDLAKKTVTIDFYPRPLRGGRQISYIF